MGSVFNKQAPRSDMMIDPNSEIAQKSQVYASRSSFVVMNLFWQSDKVHYSSMWIVHARYKPNEKYFMKTLDKKELWDIRKVKESLEELQFLKANQNDNILKLRYAFRDFKLLYQISEYCEGFTLEKLIRTKIFTEGQTKAIVCYLIRLLQSIHMKGFVLTNLRPETILYCSQTKSFKLTDMFEMIRIGKYQDPCGQQKFNIYAAPEVIMRDEALPHSDFYSVGMIMYELMNQRKPFVLQQQTRKNLLQINVTISKSDLPQGWTPEAADFIIKLLIKSPRYRLGSNSSVQVRKHEWLINYDWLNDKDKVQLEDINVSEQKLERNVKMYPDESYKELTREFKDYFYVRPKEKQIDKNISKKPESQIVMY